MISVKYLNERLKEPCLELLIKKHPRERHKRRDLQRMRKTDEGRGRENGDVAMSCNLAGEIEVELQTIQTIIALFILSSTPLRPIL